MTLSYRGEGFHRIKHKNKEVLETLVRRGRIRILLESNVLAIDPEAVRLQTGEEVLAVPNEVVFVLIGGEPPFPLLRRAGVRFGGETA